MRLLFRIVAQRCAPYPIPSSSRTKGMRNSLPHHRIALDRQRAFLRLHPPSRRRPMPSMAKRHMDDRERPLRRRLGRTRLSRAHRPSAQPRRTRRLTPRSLQRRFAQRVRIRRFGAPRPERNLSRPVRPLRFGRYARPRHRTRALPIGRPLGAQARGGQALPFIAFRHRNAGVLRIHRLRRRGLYKPCACREGAIRLPTRIRLAANERFLKRLQAQKRPGARSSSSTSFFREDGRTRPGRPFRRSGNAYARSSSICSMFLRPNRTFSPSFTTTHGTLITL